MEEINQIPEIQPVQTTQPTKNTNIFKYLFIVSIIILLGVIIGFYFVLNNKISKLTNKQTENPVVTQPISTVTNIPTVIPTTKSTISSLVKLDEKNNFYSNPKFGFSLIIPKTANQGSCQKTDDSYTLNGSEQIPITFFENQDTVYIAGEYFYKLIGEQRISKGEGYISKFSGCQKVNSTFELINKKDSYSPSSLKIYIANIKNDSELEQFIKSKYGSGCRLGEKTLSNSDTYSVKILSDGKGLDESQCPINFMIDTKYNPTKGKVVIFELGQACNLVKDSKIYSCYDTDIVNSLKFN